MPLPRIKLTRKLNGDEQQSIVTWIAIFKKDLEIVDLFREEFGKEVNVREVNYYRHADCWQSSIQKQREQYSSQMFKVELANERKRIEKLQDVVERNYDKGKDDLVIKGIHEIHEELTKGEPLIQNNYQFNLYKEMSEDEFDKRELELLAKRKKIKEEINAKREPEARTDDADSGTSSREIIQGE